MPFTVSRLETRIYLYQASDEMTIAEMVEGMRAGVALAEKHGENPHVQIIDLGDAGQIPVDVPGLARVSSAVGNNIRYTFIIKATSTTQTTGRVIQKVLPSYRRMQFLGSIEEARTLARTLLAETQAPDNGIKNTRH